MRLEVTLSGRCAKTYGDFSQKVLKRAGEFFHRKEKTILSVSFVDDASMRALNRRYRGKDKTTNVLSFSAPASPAEKSARDLGDIVVSAPKAKKEAKENGWTIEYSFARLLVHGFLHLLDYDHVRRKDAKKMESLEEKILAGIFPKEKNKNI